MESKNLLTLAITLTVGIILAGSLLMPVISDATKTTGILNNATGSQLGYLIEIDDESEYTMTWDVTTPDVVEVNGENVTLYAGTVICGGDPDFIIRYYSGSTKYIQGRDGTTNFTANSTLDISIASGTITIEADENTYTYSITKGFALAKSGEYVMKSSAQAAYMLADSEFNAYGVSSTDGSSLWLKISGTIADGATAERISGASGTLSDVEIHSTAVDGYIGVYALDKLTLSFVNSSTDVTTDLTYNYFIVPASIEAELSEHLNPGEIAIMNALPVLIIVALVMMAAGALFLKRDD